MKSVLEVLGLVLLTVGFSLMYFPLGIVLSGALLFAVAHSKSDTPQ